MNEGINLKISDHIYFFLSEKELYEIYNAGMQNNDVDGRPVQNPEQNFKEVVLKVIEKSAKEKLGL